MLKELKEKTGVFSYQGSTVLKELKEKTRVLLSGFHCAKGS